MQTSEYGNPDGACAIDVLATGDKSAHGKTIEQIPRTQLNLVQVSLADDKKGKERQKVSLDIWLGQESYYMLRRGPKALLILL
jgi:hypothetical protein